MKNLTKCPNCEIENNFYNLNCINCSSLIRERIVNIDLWFTIGKIIESPSKAFKNIVFAENKNYASFVSIFFAAKLTFNSFFLQSLVGKNINYENYLGINFLIGLIGFLLFFLLASVAQKLILKAVGVNTRFKDNFSLFVYSSVPLLISLFIFFPVEYALFGKFWLFFNPSPYFIKSTPAYIFTGLEIIILVWNLVLFYFLSFVQTKSKIYSIIFAIIGLIAIGMVSFTLPYL